VTGEKHEGHVATFKRCFEIGVQSIGSSIVEVLALEDAKAQAFEQCRDRLSVRHRVVQLWQFGVAVITGDQRHAFLGVARQHTDEDHELMAAHLARVTVRKGHLELQLRADDGAVERRLTVPWSFTPSARKRESLMPHSASTARPIRAESRARLIEGIAKARLWLDQLLSGEIEGTRQIVLRERCTERSVRVRLGLAFLSPAIVQAAVDGTLPRGCGVAQCLDLPNGWSEQWHVLSGQD